MLECILSKQVIVFLAQILLLNHNQHGFCNGRSCVTQFAAVMDMGASIIDLQKN